MRRFLISLMSLAALAVPTASWEASMSANLGVAVSSSQVITAVSISNSTFTGGAAAGTVVANIGVTMSPASPAFSGTLSLSGANASRFQIVDSNLETNGVVSSGTYSINIIAIQTGSTGSPFTQAETITGTITLSGGSCPQGNALPDGCPGAPVGTAQFPHLLDTQQVIMLNIIPGSGYTNGTYSWTTSGGGGSGANGTVTVSGGQLGGSNSQGYTITSHGAGYTSRPTINVSGLTGGSSGSITPTVYQATPHNASTKWNMPGVDYYVGIPSGTVLKDPTVPANLPTGASYASSTVTVTGCNVTLNGFDFTLHNTVVVVNVSGPNCTTTIENSNFQANGTALQPIANLTSLGSGGAFVFRQNDYNGLAAIGGSGSGFAVNDPIQGSGNISLLYNYLHNFDSKIIQVGGTSPSSPFVEKYNLFADFGYCDTPPCSHGEAEYSYSGGTISYTGEFNTYILHFTTGPGDLTAPHAVQADNMHINGTADDHNVVLVPGPQSTCSSSNRTAYRAAAAVFDGAQNDPGASSLSNITFQYDYIDNSGTYFPWYHNATGGATNTTVSTNNIDAGTGGSCN
jgi:hypothetical protein